MWWKRRQKTTTRELVPDYLRSTYDLITAAFPTGIDADLYVPLLALLVDHMSHRNLRDVIYIVTGRELHLAYNDVIGALGAEVSEADQIRLRGRLEPHGLAAWLAES
jgi:hypothetical protein